MLRRYRTAITVAAIVAAFLLGFVLRGGGGTAGDPAHDMATADQPTAWTCSMHPQIQLPEFGQCPICFMDLIPLMSDTSEGLGPRDLRLSKSAVALAEITTAPIERRFVARELALVGKVTADETRQRVITARVPGRLDRLHVDFTGREVRQGEPLADVYSPDLYRARAELLAARAAAERGEPGAEANLRSVRERLRLWDVDPDQVAAEGGDRITISSPVAGTVVRKDAVEGAYVATGQPLLTIADLSSVWVELAAYERDLPWLAAGQSVAFTVTASPGEVFDGIIVFVDPVVDDRTRTVSVRLEADNPDGRLRPGMLARGRVLVELAADGRPRAGRDDAMPPLVVPATAPLVTGERAVVYLREPGEEPIFRGREVTLGPRAGDWYLVSDGLGEGELVVVHGAFKLDSELQIQARPSMMLPDGGGSGGGHHHGEPGSAPAAPEPESITVPDGFLAVAPDLLGRYLDLQTALAADAAEDSEQAAAALAKALHGAGAAVPADLHPAASTLAAAGDIAARRQAFEPVSDLLWATLEAAGYGEDGAVRRFHCPMAFDNKGAYWIQRDPTTANPYYGSMMLRCGSEVARIGAEEGGS